MVTVISAIRIALGCVSSAMISRERERASAYIRVTCALALVESKIIAERFVWSFRVKSWASASDRPSVLHLVSLLIYRRFRWTSALDPSRGTKNLDRSRALRWSIRKQLRNNQQCCPRHKRQENFTHAVAKSQPAVRDTSIVTFSSFLFSQFSRTIALVAQNTPLMKWGLWPQLRGLITPIFSN